MFFKMFLTNPLYIKHSKNGNEKHFYSFLKQHQQGRRKKVPIEKDGDIKGNCGVENDLDDADFVGDVEGIVVRSQAHVRLLHAWGGKEDEEVNDNKWQEFS